MVGAHIFPHRLAMRGARARYLVHEIDNHSPSTIFLFVSARHQFRIGQA